MRDRDGTASPADDSKRHQRAQHNALERRRRDNIKDMYLSIKDIVSDNSNEKLARSQILKKAFDKIENNEDELKQIEAEVRQLEREIADKQRKVDEETKKLKARKANS